MTLDSTFIHTFAVLFASRAILSANVEHRAAAAAPGFDGGVWLGLSSPLRAQLAQGLLPLPGELQFLWATRAGGVDTIERAVGGAVASVGSRKPARPH